MEIYRVLFSSPGLAQTEYLVSAGQQVIGRSSKADIVLAGDSVSRRHARLFVEDRKLCIEDLGSSNGVLVNDEPVTRRLLEPGDRVQIGCYLMQIESFDAAAKKRFTKRTEIKESEVAPIHERLMGSERSSIAFLYQISQCLCVHRTLRPLLQGVMSSVMENIPAERGYILTRPDRHTSMKLQVSEARDPEETGPPLSHTLIDHVVKTKTSVLTADASEDDRFEDSESIAKYKIKAVICVPLLGRDEVFGALYLDTHRGNEPLKQEHLQLLSIVGQVLGAGVENITLNERQIRQERLAGIGETVSGTSHDMRNIMMGMLGATEMIEMASEERDWDSVDEGTGFLRQTLERFQKLSEGMLDYARAKELVLEDTNLQELVDEVIGTVGHEAEARSIAMRFTHQAPGRVLMDSHQMYRVLLNLVRNAMDALEGEGGSIDIESGTEAGAVFVRVKDTGPGIPPEHLSKIGQPFFTTKKDKGTGLGLATCFRIMEQHHGRIDVDSAPNAGTSITLLFPPDQTATQHDYSPP